MAETIRGINVVIGAETTGLSKALSDVNKKSRDIQTELKQVEKLLKLDPGNTELLSQKQKLLSDSIINTANNLRTLRTAQQQVNEQFAKGEISEGQYRAFQRELVKTETELKNLDSKLDETTATLKEQGVVVSKLGKDYQESFDQAKQAMGNSFEQMKKVGAGVTALGAGIAAGLGVAVKGAADFEQGMANVYSVMAPEEVSEFRDELKDLAVTMGADTKYSAKEAATGIEELVKAGISVQDILNGGLSGALSLATAGELELGDAAEIASTALNAFKADAISVQDAADILAGAANASATNVQELKTGLAQVSSVAASVGMSFEDTVTALAAFAQNGIKGSDAGTSLKTMLMNLQPSTKQAADEMERLGIITADGQNQFIDANGQFKDLSSIADVLRKSLSGLNDAQRQAALRIMFGSDAIRAANILYNEGAEGIDKMAEAMSKISAQDVAAQKMNTLKGSMEELSGSIETAQIAIGSALIPALRAIAGFVQKVVDVFNKMPQGMQSFIAIAGAVTAALALIAGPLLMLIGFLPQIMAGFTALGPVMAAITGPIGLIVAGVAALAAGLVYLYNNNETVKNALNTAWEFIKSAAISIFNSIKEFWAEWGDEIVAFFKKVFEIYITIWKTIFQAIWEFIKFIFGEIKAFWDKWGDTITQTFKNVFEILKIVFKTVFDVISTIVKTVFNGIKAFWDKWGDTITSQFKAAFGIVKAIFEGTWNAIKITIETVIGVISGIVKTWLAIFKGDWKGAWEGMKETVSAIWTGITDLFKNSFNTMKEIGKNIIEGLINGIKGMKDAVVQTAKDVANSIGDGVKDFFGIHSPSRLMLGYGKNIVQGLANGISETARQAVKSASAVSSAVSDAMSFNVGGLSAAANSALSGSNVPSVAGGTANQTNVSFADMFRGANFVVRDNSDITKIAQQLGGVVTQNLRALGGA